ncbi:MAG TPA: glycosyl hydrolase family 28-related protein [Longimicrobium sp.]|jgi:hypothetical protein
MFQDVKTHGAAGNGTADDRAAFAAADGAGGTVYVPRGTYRIGSNLTLASDVRFEQGAKLKPDANVVVTLNGGLDAGVYQVFDPSAGGSVRPNRVEHVVPQWWGAVADGVADDYPAIAAALRAVTKTSQYGSGSGGAIVFFPPGVYRVTQPLDCGNPGQVNLQGSGRFETVIRGDTGAGHAIIEMVGTRFASVRDLQLDVVGMANPSTVGILMARVSINGFAAQAGNVDLSNVVIQLRSSATANGGKGTVGIYNYCSEVCDYRDVYVIADTAAVYTAGNIFNLASVHRPAGSQYPMFTGDSSMTVCTMSGANVLAGLAGPALLLAGCANIKVDSHLTSTWREHQAEGLTGPYRYAINVVAQLTDFEFHGDIEEYPVVLRNQVSISGMRLHAYSAWSLTDPRVYLDRVPNAPSHATLVGCTIDVVPTPDSYLGATPGASGYLIDTTADAASQVVGCELYLRSGKVRIQNPWGNSNLTGNTVYFDGDLADLVFQAPVVAGNLIHAKDKTSVARLAVENAVAASTPGSVVRKVEIFDAAGASLGFVPVYNSIS